MWDTLLALAVYMSFLSYFHIHEFLERFIYTGTMFAPQGQALLLTVSVLTSLGFMLIGYDNGLMGGLGKCLEQLPALTTPL